MPAQKRQGSTVAVDTVPLPERVVRGKITKVGKRYFLTVARRRQEIPISVALPEAKIRPMVGKPVAVAYSRKSRRSIVAIGTWPTPELPVVKPKFRCVLCYIPGPDVIRRLEKPVRDKVISELTRAGILSRQLGKLLTR